MNRLTWAVFVFVVAMGGGSSFALSEELSSPHFRFVVGPHERKAALGLMETAEIRRTELCELLPICRQDVIEVRITGSSEEFLLAQPGGAHIDWASGVAYGDLGLIVLRTDATHLFSLEETFQHELSHALLLGSLPNRPPRWFIEGLAIFQAGENILGRFESLASAAVADRLLPLSSLAVSFPGSAAQRSLAYAESAFFVAYLVKRFGEEALSSFIGELEKSRPFHLAFKAVYGGSVREMEADWTASFQKSAWGHLLVSNTFLWSTMSVLFVVALAVAWRKRRRRLLRMERMERIHAVSPVEESDWEWRQ